MSDAKDMGPKTIKPEAFKTAAEAGKKAFMAYVEAGAQMGAHMDRMVRAQAELVSASLETGLEAREAARRATVELIEGAFAATK